MSFFLVSGILAADVADAGTVLLSYPAGQVPGTTTNPGTFTNGLRHRAVINQVAIDSPVKFSVSFGAVSSGITVTNKSGATWAAGSAYTFQFEATGVENLFDPTAGVQLVGTTGARLLVVTLGAPLTLSTTAVLNVTAVPATGTNVLTTPVVLSAPRALQIVTSSAGNTTNVITITGTDCYGVAMSEAFTANGTTAVTGKKAFQKITSITSSVIITGTLSVGTTDILGLPVMVPSSGVIIKELLDGAVATAGTFVAGVQTAGGSTTTTGDVRGTYLPNSATNSARSWQLIVALPDAGYLGMPQA